MAGLFMFLNVSAQTERNYESVNPNSTEENFMKQFDGLNLTEDQQNKLKVYYATNKENRKAERSKRLGITNQTVDTNSEIRKSKFDFNSSDKNEIKEILTTEQYTQYQENRKNRRTQKK